MEFRTLDRTETEKFRLWARENPETGDPIEEFYHPAIKAEWARLACAYCAEPGMKPSHYASPRCESGQRDHCSCDVCF